MTRVGRDSLMLLPAITLAKAHPYILPLKQHWRTAAGVITERRGWIIELITTDGRSGWGDCAPLPEAGTETLTTAQTAISTLLPHLLGQSLLIGKDDFIELSHYPPSLRCGVETAILDLAAQSAGVSLAKLLDTEAKSSMPINAAVGSVDAGLTQRVHNAITTGYQILKIKVGLHSWATEEYHLKNLVAGLPNSIKLRLDANQAWSETEARSTLNSLIGLPIESVEEPIMDANFSTLAHLQTNLPFALALDESLAKIPPETILHCCPVRRLILKPTVLGSLTRTLAIAKLAHQLGLECVITSTLESNIGLKALAQLAAAIPGDLAHGLATGDWFTYNLTPDLPIKKGYLFLDNNPGLGINIKHTNIMTI